MKRGIISLILLIVFTFSLSAQRILKTFQGHTNVISSAQFSANGKVIISGSWDKTIRIWNPATGTASKIIEAGNTTVFSVAMNRDMRSIASACWSPTVTLYSTQTGEKLKSFMAHPNKVDFLTYSPDGKTLVTAGDDTIKLWDATSLAFKGRLAGTIGDIHMVVFSPDSKIIASNSTTGNIKIWNAATGELIKTLYAHINNSPAVVFSSDGKFLASLGEEGTVKIWDASSFSLLTTFTKIIPGANCMDLSIDNRTLALAGKDNNAYLFDIVEKKIVATLKGHSKPITHISFSPDGNMVLTVGSDYQMMLWDITDIVFRDCISAKMEAHSKLVAPKDEFETTDQYNKRLKEYEVLKYEKKKECMEEAKSQQAQQQANTTSNPIETYKYVTLKITDLSAYNADKQTYDVTIEGVKYQLKMALAEAKSFKGVWQTATVKGIQRANPSTKKLEYINLQVIHPLTNVSYPLGNQVSPTTDKYLKEFMDKNPEPKS